MGRGTAWKAVEGREQSEHGRRLRLRRPSTVLRTVPLPIRFAGREDSIRLRDASERRVNSRDGLHHRCDPCRGLDRLGLDAMLLEHALVAVDAHAAAVHR